MIAFPNSVSSSADIAVLSSGVPLEAVRSFAERLADLPTRAWLEVGHSLLRDPSSHASRATAYALIEATINGRGLAVAAWYACDAIETSASYADRASCWTRSDRRAFAAAHSAAEDAALALLAAPFVAAADRATLIAPFDRLVREAIAAV